MKRERKGEGEKGKNNRQMKRRGERKKERNRQRKK